MIVTFDDKAKEIIKNIVTEGGTPEPTPVPGGLTVNAMPAGNYMFNVDKFLDFLTARGIDIDTETTYFDVICGICIGQPNGQNYIDVGTLVIKVSADCGSVNLYINYSGVYPYNKSFYVSDEPSNPTIRSLFEYFKDENTTLELTGINEYIPLFIVTDFGSHTYTPITIDDIKTFIVAE